VLEIADMLIDLRREKLRLVERVAQCVRLILPQLQSQAAADDDQERTHGGNHQAQQPRSDCAKQHQPAHLRASRISAGGAVPYRSAGFR
jgi:hypothetical protein